MRNYILVAKKEKPQTDLTQIDESFMTKEGRIS
jgi:hypothetical protein